MPFAFMLQPWFMIVCMVATAGVTIWGAFIGTRKAVKMFNTTDDVVSLVETRHELLCEINRQLDCAGWFTKWRIRKKLERKGLYDPKKKKVC